MSKRILLVEDEALIALDIEGILAGHGHDVTYSASRAEAMRLLDAMSFDLAVIDYFLKDGDAGPLAAELSSRGIPFIICSGSTGLEELNSGVRCAAFLAKPFSTDGLMAAISHAFTKAPNSQRMQSQEA